MATNTSDRSILTFSTNNILESPGFKSSSSRFSIESLHYIPRIMWCMSFSHCIFSSFTAATSCCKIFCQIFFFFNASISTVWSPHILRLWPWHCGGEQRCSLLLVFSIYKKKESEETQASHTLCHQVDKRQWIIHKAEKCGRI